MHCESAKRCGDKLSYLLGSDYDCETYLGARILENSKAPLGDGSAAFDAELAAQCLSEIQDCSVLGTVRWLPASCTEAWAGAAAIGESCLRSTDCVTGSYCEGDGQCPGVCTALAEAGEACTNWHSCAPGTLCAADTHTCVPVPARGDSCDSVGYCSSISVCEDWNDDGDKTCEAPTTIYSAAENESCATTKCVLGLVCSQGSLCKQPAAEGASCVDVACAPGLACEAGSCVALPATGESCSTKCATFGETCYQGTCKARGRLGDACDAAGDCVTFNCVDNVCESYAECALPPR